MYRYFDILALSAFPFLRHRIVAGAAPGIASQDAPDGEVKTFDGTVLDDGLLGILRAGGRETADRRRERADASLVEDDGGQQYPLQDDGDEMPDTPHIFRAIRSNRLFMRLSTSADGRHLSVCQMKARASDWSSGSKSFWWR